MKRDRPGGKGEGRKNHEIDTREIEGKVLPLADDSRDGRVWELCFVASREIEFRCILERSFDFYVLPVYNDEID